MAAAGDCGQLVIVSCKHTSSCIMCGAKCFGETSITQVTHPPYCPDLAPCDFWFFPKLKTLLKGKRFQTINEIQGNRREQLMEIPTKDFAEWLLNSGRDTGRTV